MDVQFGYTDRAYDLLHLSLCSQTAKKMFDALENTCQSAISLSQINLLCNLLLIP